MRTFGKELIEYFEFQLEDDVPEPLTCNLLKFYIDPHDESYDGYEEAMKETK